MKLITIHKHKKESRCSESQMPIMRKNGWKEGPLPATEEATPKKTVEPQKGSPKAIESKQ